MMTSSKGPPSGHNKYYFLKVNIKDYYHGKFQVYIIFSFRKKQGGNLPHQATSGHFKTKKARPVHLELNWNDTSANINGAHPHTIIKSIKDKKFLLIT